LSQPEGYPKLNGKERDQLCLQVWEYERFIMVPKDIFIYINLVIACKIMYQMTSIQKSIQTQETWQSLGLIFAGCKLDGTAL